MGAEAAREPASHLGARVAALGVAQIVSWGTLFYAIAVLGAAMRAELGVSDVLLFGAYSAGLFLSGAVSPAVGRWIDAGHARLALAGGSCLGALALALLAAAQGPATLIAGFLVSGAAMALTLYDPAFATLHVMSGTLYRRAVTALTLFGGFASTVFWPLALALQEGWGWRAAFATFAALHIIVCLPVHLAAIPRGTPRAGDRAAVPGLPSEMADAGARATFAWLASALAAAAFIAAALSAHAIGLLTAAGLTAGQAVLAGSLIGPMQVAGRIVEFTAGRRLRARTVGTVAFALMATALLLLALAHGLPPGGLRVRARLRREQRRDDDRARDGSRRAVRPRRLRRASWAASHCPSSSRAPSRRWRSRCAFRSIPRGRLRHGFWSRSARSR